MKSFLEVVREEKSGEVYHVMTFGRMNPPTSGHLKLINKVKEIAKKHNVTSSVVISHSQDSKKNPLSAEQKVKHLKRYMAEPISEAVSSNKTKIVAATKEKPTILHHAAAAHSSGVTHLHVVVGSDRVKEMHDLLHRYNGVPGKHGHYNFKKIHVHSAGQRDPDAEGTEGMSGTKMREHARSGNFKEFRKGVPGHVSDTHAKELMHDTRKGMGIHEAYNHGLFKAIFVTGGPGSGKDIVIREAIAESKIVELNFIQAQDYLNDKQKLAEKTGDLRREGIRNRGPLIINGPADDRDRIAFIKEELEELGYDTMMIFVETNNETSQKRNSLLSKMMLESVRHDKWMKSQENTKYFNEAFKTFIYFDNTGDLDSKEEDIHSVYESTSEFLGSETLGETAEEWLNRRSSSLFKEIKNVKSNFRNIQEASPGQQLQRKLGKVDSVRDGDVKYNSSYTFKAYSEDSGPKVEVLPSPKESNFSKDKEKVKSQKFSSRMFATNTQGVGVGPTFSSRSGLPAGLGDQTYKEQKEFRNF
jgi:predicted kinase